MGDIDDEWKELENLDVVRKYGKNYDFKDNEFYRIINTLSENSEITQELKNLCIGIKNGWNNKIQNSPNKQIEMKVEEKGILSYAILSTFLPFDIFTLC